VRRRLGAQLIIGVGLVLAVSIGLTTMLTLRAYQSEMIAQLTRSAGQLSGTIESSLHDNMLENHPEKIHQQILAMGSQGGIESIRLFDRVGRIRYSSDAGEVGQIVDKRSDTCRVCHMGEKPVWTLEASARSRIFSGPDGSRRLGIINPIENQESCWNAACHAHEKAQAVLGALDVTVSLADMEAGMARSRARAFLAAICAIGTSALIFWWLNRRAVLRPVRALVDGTRRVAEGDLSTTIPAERKDEMGELARAFNEMVRHLGDTQRQLTQANKLASVGRLAAGVAHEINNPLTGVLTYASFLLKRAGDHPETKADLEVIVRETMRCRDIVKGLLDFARQTPPRRQPSDLNEVARRAVSVVMNQLALERVALTLDLAADLPKVSIDANQMQQVVLNLLLNAADAVGNAGGGIQVSTRRVDLPPIGHEPIRKASCPRGCDLIEPTLKIRGLPAVRVIKLCRGREIVVDLDPVYGRAGHVTAGTFEAGTVASYFCSRCRASLQQSRPCGACGAGTFAVETAPGDLVFWCARKGCHWSLWESKEAAGPRPVLELSVADTGCGISPEDQQHLFEPFFSTKGHHGTGLGLAVTWGIVESHGSTIDVESDPGRGTRFTVRLSLAEEASAVPDARRAPAEVAHA
jgi:two-component system NtrC family sensor kinase